MKSAIKFLQNHLLGYFPFLYAMTPMFHPVKVARSFFKYYFDLFKYNHLHTELKGTFPIGGLNTRPILFDWFESAGEVPRHYFLQDIWAARKVYEAKVTTHYDIGSRLNGFIAHCVVFTKVVMLDIRPLKLKLKNLEFIETDATNMKNIASGSIHSLSSLHAIEHFGLGRYGDPIDPNGYAKAISEISRVMHKGGNVYFAVPIGRQRVEFNAHRIFNPQYVVELFRDFQLVEFSAIDDRDIYTEHADMKLFENANYSCGLFHFRKK